MMAWCHGAPGLALTRARAHELLGDEELRQEAETALDATDRFTRALLRAGRANYSLCHGLAGNAEVCLEAERILGGSASRGAALAVTVAEAGVAAFFRAGRPWPSGTHAGQAPGLMLGNAGVGMFLLRVAGHRPASILLPRSTPADVQESVT